MDQIFNSISKELEAENELREEIRKVVRDLERLTRGMQAMLQQSHHDSNGTNNYHDFLYSLILVKAICDRVSQQFGELREKYRQIASLIPADGFYK